MAFEIINLLTYLLLLLHLSSRSK